MSAERTRFALALMVVLFAVLLSYTLHLLSAADTTRLDALELQRQIRIEAGDGTSIGVK